MKIYLVRHGRTSSNYAKQLSGRNINTGITSFGAKQVKMLGNHLKNEGAITLMRVSPLLRTVQTAEILEKYLDVHAKILDDRLIERDFGIFEGLNKEELFREKEAKGIGEGELMNYFPCGIGKTELVSKVHHRVKQCIVSDLEEYGDEGVIMYLTHAGVIHAFIGTELGIPENRIKPFKIQEASYFRCELDKEHIIQVMELWNNKLY